jgi:predicted nucleic acid-binding protein
MIYIIDTYAWIEYINGSNKALILKRLFQNPNNKFITMECCIAELAGFSLKKNLNFEKIFELVKTNSIILPVLTKNWIEAAKIRSELRKKIQHFGLIDAILVSKQKELKSKVISGDPHFKTLKNIVYIGN